MSKLILAALVAACWGSGVVLAVVAAGGMLFDRRQARRKNLRRGCPGGRR